MELTRYFVATIRMQFWSSTGNYQHHANVIDGKGVDPLIGNSNAVVHTYFERSQSSKIGGGLAGAVVNEHKSTKQTLKKQQPRFSIGTSCYPKVCFSVLILHWLSPLSTVLCSLIIMVPAVFLIQRFQAVISALLHTFNTFYNFAESVCVCCLRHCTSARSCAMLLFQGLHSQIGNLSCMLSWLTEPSSIHAAVHVKDLMYGQYFYVRRTLAKSCDKVAQQVEFNEINNSVQCDGHDEVVAAGFRHTLPVATESPRDKFYNNTIAKPPEAARAFAPAADEDTLPACLLVYNANMVHFERSAPCYIPAVLNGGESGKVMMRPLQELSASHAVFGGPMTHHINRYGVRVRKHTPRRGIICKGKVSCDNDGRINARKLNNDSLHAIAAARKRFL